MRTIIVLTAALAVILMFASETRALDLSVGASTWYSDWYFKQTGQEASEVDPALMYGPVVSLGFNKEWSWSNVLLLGKFTLHNSDSSTMELSRLDYDSTLNYNISRYIKAFAGAKYMRYDNNGNSFHHQSLGPAAGVGFTMPVTDNLFLLGTASVIYMWGKHESEEGSTHQTEPGFNSTLALAYYFDSISTTVSLGGRFQYFRSYFDDNNVSEDIEHRFYGVTLSAIYTFNL